MLLFLACAPPSLTCRAPDVWVTNAEGVEAGYCTVTFDACEGEERLDVTCDNDTFDGDYACGWMLMRGTRLTTGEFSSPDFCRLDAAGMVAVLQEETPLDLTVE